MDWEEVLVGKAHQNQMALAVVAKAVGKPSSLNYALLAAPWLDEPPIKGDDISAIWRLTTKFNA